MSNEVTWPAMPGIPTIPHGPNMLMSWSLARMRVSSKVLRTPLVPAKSNRYNAEMSKCSVPATPSSSKVPSVWKG